MKIVFPDEMRAIDKQIIELGMPSIMLMENAARSLLSVIQEIAPKKVLVLCGTGNNGGDGYALARLLLNIGIESVVISIGSPDTDDSKKNFELFDKLGGIVYKLEDLSGEILNKLILISDLIVDGIYGTGFRDCLSDEMINLIELLNSARGKRIAIDIPSGVDGEKGSVNPVAFKADKTVTFGVPKVGQFLYPGRDYTGELVIATAGFPINIIDGVSSMTLIDQPLVASILPERPVNGHKGSFGRVLIIGGSRDYTGAPLLSAMGALRTGTGLVYTFTPSHVQKIIRGRLPEIIALAPLDEEENLSEKHFAYLTPLLDKIDCLVIGPGIGRKDDTVELVRKTVKKAIELNKFIVIDADGIYAISDLADRIGGTENILLTPHIGEFASLAKTTPEKLKNNPRLAHKLCRFLDIRILLKSDTSFLVERDGSWLNIAGNTGLSKGGSGDLLAGSIAGFTAQSKNITAGAILGAYFLGKSAELSGKAEAFITPSEISLDYEKVFRFLEDKNNGI